MIRSVVCVLALERGTQRGARAAAGVRLDGRRGAMELFLAANVASMRFRRAFRR